MKPYVGAPAFEVGQLLYTNDFSSFVELAVYVVDKVTPFYADKEKTRISSYRYRILRLFQISVTRFLKEPGYRAAPETTKTCVEYQCRHSLGIIREDLFRLRNEDKQMSYNQLCVRNVSQRSDWRSLSSYKKLEDIDAMNQNFKRLLTRHSHVGPRAQRINRHTDFTPLFDYFRSRVEAIASPYFPPANSLSHQGLIDIP